MKKNTPQKTKITNWTSPPVKELAAELLEMALVKVVEKGLFKRVKKLPADPWKGIGFEVSGRYYQDIPVKADHLKKMQVDFQKFRARIGGILNADDQMQWDRINGLFREAIKCGMLLHSIGFGRELEPLADKGQKRAEIEADMQRESAAQRRIPDSVRNEIIAAHRNKTFTRISQTVRVPERVDKNGNVVPSRLVSRSTVARVIREYKRSL